MEHANILIRDNRSLRAVRLPYEESQEAIIVMPCGDTTVEEMASEERTRINDDIDSAPLIRCFIDVQVIAVSSEALDRVDWSEKKVHLQLPRFSVEYRRTSELTVFDSC